MKREAIGEGPTVEEAIDCALEELGVQQDAVDYEVIEEGGRKLFGLGSDRIAKVRVWLKGEFVDELEEAKRVAREILDVESDEPAEAPVASPEPHPAFEDEPERTEEELDRIADAAVATIQTVLDKYGIEASIEEYEGDEGELILDVVDGDLAVLIGRHGKTLDALQTLTAAIANRAVGFRHPVVVDVEGYRARRREKLEEIAQRAAERAARQRQPVKLRPMSSFERRVVHVALRDDRRVTTGSEGEEPFRHVIVRPK
jgi:spoIIIJ-associated protein